MDGIETLKQWVMDSDNIVFFGGAGVSTESGIPDFRSSGSSSGGHCHEALIPFCCRPPDAVHQYSASQLPLTYRLPQALPISYALH